MMLKRYSPADKDAWNGFVRNAKNGLFMFDRNFMDYHSDRFTDHSLLAHDENGSIIALLPANEKDGVLHSHQGLTFGGFVTDIGMKATRMLELFAALKDYATANGLRKLIYKPIPHTYHLLPAEEDLYALFRNGARLVRTDLTTTVSIANRIGFSELRKRGEKKAIRSGVTLQLSTDYQSYMSLVAKVLQERHGTVPVHTAEEIALLASRFEDNIKLYTAEKEGSLLAGVLMFEYDRLAHAQYIAASPEARNVGALDALFSHLINTVYAGKQYFDFGKSTDKNGSFLNEGLIGQKEGFGGRGIVHQFFEIEWA
jgi:hypothetical protein